MSGRVIWITGMSGAGKTTLAKALLPHLVQPRLLLDGDEMRDAFSFLAGGYDIDSRRALAHTYARLCRLVSDQGLTVVCATVSMFHEVRKWNRENLAGYLEVYLDASEEILRAQDYKMVYNDTGDDSLCLTEYHTAVELPKNPDLHFIQGRECSIPFMVQEILRRLAHCASRP